MSTTPIGITESHSRTNRVQAIVDSYNDMQGLDMTTAKALNPIIAMHKAMDTAQKAVNDSVRTERNLDKEHRTHWEAASLDKSEEYRKNVDGDGSSWRIFPSGLGRSKASFVNALISTVGIIASSTAAGKDFGASVQNLLPGISNTVFTHLQMKLDGSMPKHDFFIGLQRNLFDNGQSSVQQLQRAIEEMRQKQLELIKLEGRAQGAPG